jgi:hypothetical protein
MSIETVLLQAFIKRFQEYKSLADKTFSQVRGDEMHFQPNEASNSIAMIIRHMNGNMLSRWTNFMTEDGEKSWRKRDEEFEVSSMSYDQLIEHWNEGWKVFMDTLHSLRDEDLQKTITIRSQPLTVADAIIRQMAHYGYHVGQIVYLGRWIRQGEWRSLSIPKGGSKQFNQDMEQSRH